ncbi:uncharacterized protein LOC119089828 [Pollicipes pollicipes]|uniref:uncharacterized protein LOC119089828 n=1 Tax=Pollicipes pollicipes TaxID=41117 RepID=UPI00188508F2|nr:uncharacterized protein LOC119089828 [Pollicipes pollicipes]
MPRSRRSRLAAEHVQERRRRRRPLCSRRSATVAVGKSRFTMLREHAFTMMPQGNILGMYQAMVENIFKERARDDGRRRAIERSEIHETVQNQVSELRQDFHSQTEIRGLANWALRELKKEGRLQQVAPGRFRLPRRRVPPATRETDEQGAETDEAAQGRLQAWLEKRDRHRARTRMEERYRRRQRRLSQSPSPVRVSDTALGPGWRSDNGGGSAVSRSRPAPHRARTRMEERYRRRQRRLSQSSSSDVLSTTASEQSIGAATSEQSVSTDQ